MLFFVSSLCLVIGRIQFLNSGAVTVSTTHNVAKLWGGVKASAGLFAYGVSSWCEIFSYCGLVRLQDFRKRPRHP
jgi:hypothetical protein